uniref:Uncharacterized protein n=1 Tax=Arundo donax TaxID=35708 RepID=A0A0A9G0K9_ARUDO
MCLKNHQVWNINFDAPDVRQKLLNYAELW